MAIGLTSRTFGEIVNALPGRQMLRRCGLVCLTAMLGLAACVVAQTNTGNVYGNVVDEQGAPIPGGTATLTGAAAPRTASVDVGGVYRFPRVAPGRYTVTVTMPGLAAATRENIRSRWGRTRAST